MPQRVLHLAGGTGGVDHRDNPVFCDEAGHFFEYLAGPGFDAVDGDIFADELVGVDACGGAGEKADEADGSTDPDRPEGVVEVLAPDCLDDVVSPFS